MKIRKRLITAIVAIILATACTALAASADSSEIRKTPEVKAHTLSLKDNVHILYAVDFGDLPSTAEYGILAWVVGEGESKPASFTHANVSSAQILVSEGTDTVEGVKCEVFRLSVLAARQMTDTVYAVPYVRYQGDADYIYGKPTKYSILQYTLGSKVNDDNAHLIETMLNYGAKAQAYYDYNLDTLANEKYVLARAADAVFADGFSHEILKPGAEVKLTGGAAPLVSGTEKLTYLHCDDGRGFFVGEGKTVTAPDVSFTVSHTAEILNEDFQSRSNNSSSGKYTGGGELMANNKGDSTYVLITDASGNKYVKHCKAAGSGNDSQSDSSNGSFDIQDHLYDNTTATFADKKLTISIKLARTEADVATAKFNLRYYDVFSSGSDRHVAYTTNVFSTTADGTVKLGGSVAVGALSGEFTEYSFVVDFGAGDVDGANNLFAYCGGNLVGAMRQSDFTTENFLVHTTDIGRLMTNFHSQGNDYGELLYDDILITSGATPKADKPLAMINYVTNGGSLGTDAAVSVPLGRTYTLPTPTRENYDFEGWFTSPAMTEDTRITEIKADAFGLITVYAKYTSSASYITSLKEKNEAFLTSDFYRVDTDNYYNLAVSEGGNGDKYPLADYGESITVDHIIKLDTSAYEPYATPKGKQHPYLFFTSDEIDGIRAMMNDPQFAATASKFWEYANAKNFTGEFPEGVKNDVYYRWSTTVLAQMEAKALAYLLTGDESYGYEAIIGAKNAMLTLVYTPQQHMDPYHGASQTMINVAKVYDWCYDLMTEKDKTEIILGCQNLMFPTMEYNYFQKDQGLNNNYPSVSPVSGHGTGPQFIRDYVTIALAFYTEETSWWDYIGGRYIAEYAPVMSVCYEGGWASQGTATYGTSKYFINLWAAWVIRSACGVTLDYATEEGGARDAAYFLNSHIAGNDRYFSTGDGGRNSNGSSIRIEYMLLAAAFYKDPALEAFARYYTNGYTKWTYDFTEEMTAPMTLVFSSFFADDVPEGEFVNRGDGVDLIQYFSSPNGFTSARNSWNSDSASVIMKIGELSMFNHDIADTGTFQIYYKGMLATSSGAYNKYGSNVHKYYLQSTVAQNGLLIHNPAFADATPIVNDSGAITNAGRYYYSGGQRSGSSGSTLEAWLGDGHSEMGEVIGHSEKYNEDGTAHYAYIAGDITVAYSSETVDYVGRRMLTVFTGDEKYPMLFFTFDQMTSRGQGFQKTFLLHTVKEPNVDTGAMTAEITDLDGVLVLHSLSGADSIRKIGGEGYAYWINGYYDENETWVEGKNLLDEYTTKDNSDKIWGRVELSARGNLSDSFLTAMYVTDASNTERLAVRGYETDDVKFATVLDKVAIFADYHNPIARSFTVGIKGDGLLTYYVSGIEAGTWSVIVDGTEVYNATVTDEEHFFSFTAPSGRVEFLPASDVVEAGEGKIRYETDGGTLPADAPATYRTDAVTVLPVPERGKDNFLGWYVSPSCADGERIAEIPAGLSGSTVTVYAKWQKVLINETYEGKTISVPESTTSTVNGLTYNAGSANELKPGSTHSTVTANGNTYIKITSTGKNSCVYASNNGYNLSHFTETAVSYEFDVAKLAGYSTANLQMMITTASGGYGTLGNILTFTTARQYSIFGSYVTTVKLGGKTVSGITLSESFTTIRMTIDFEAAKVFLYNADGSVLASAGLSVPTSSKGNPQPASLVEWQKLATPIFYRFEVTKSAEGSSCALAFDNIKVTEGRAFDTGESALTTNFISYETNGGRIVGEAPALYSSAEDTELPTSLEKNGYVFGGWYTDPAFSASSRITKIASGSTGMKTLYAKWETALAFEDYDGNLFNVEGKFETYDAFSYHAVNSGCSFTAEFDASGNYFLRAHNTVKSSNCMVYMTSSSHNLTHFTETAVSYQIDLRKEKGVDLSTFSVSIETSGGTGGRLSILTMNPTSGEVRLQGGTKVLATVNEDDFVTVRIAVDFAAGAIMAYDGAGNVIDSVTPSVPTVNSGAQPATLAEWQKIAAQYLFYSSIVNYRDIATTSVEIDNLYVAEGNAFA